MAAVNADWRAAPVSAKLRATLGFLEKLTLDPDNLDAADAQAARDAGVDDDALEDAAMVCVLFNTYVRLADSLRFDIPDEAGFAASARSLLGVGYRFPPPLRWITRGAVK